MSVSPSSEGSQRLHKSRGRRVRLVRQMAMAVQFLGAWNACLRSLVSESPDFGAPSGKAEQLTSLLRLVGETQIALRQRLEELEEAQPLSGPPKPAPRRVRPPSLRGSRGPFARSSNLCLKAGRSCGQVLGSVFRAALSVADSVSARILYEPLRELEKQLWLLDPRQAD